MTSKHRKILFTGNPNSGKTSLFNALTGLNHKVGNYPGVTVEKKIGYFQIEDVRFEAIDIPGTYSLYPKSLDEAIAYQTLSEPQTEDLTERLIVLVTDAAHLKRSLLYATQIIDLGFPTIMALTMTDTAADMNRSVDIDILSSEIGIQIKAVNPRTGEGIEELKNVFLTDNITTFLPKKRFYSKKIKEKLVTENISQLGYNSSYHTFHSILASDYKNHTSSFSNERLTEIQSDEIRYRFEEINGILQRLNLSEKNNSNFTSQKEKYHPDKFFLHPIFGYVFMFAILLIIFQSVFKLAAYPMDFIDAQFSNLGAWVENALPETWWSDLIVNGIIAGLGGVVIFVPQIAILFFFLTLLEDSGYLSRISFLMDRLFQFAGLSGKSVVPFLSGMACAIPAVMAARTIENPKHRLITVLVTPFMSCSARLPVYTMLISLIIPDVYYFGFIGLQGLVLMGMYMLGFITAMIAGRILTFFINKNQKSYFIQELPVYQQPRWRNAFQTMYEKSKVFVLQAGKIIITISIVLWFLLNYGPSSKRDVLEEKYAGLEEVQGSLTEEQEKAYNAELMETSYGGILGKFIEPVIQPLGYDWKIGIALISSFVAREVFVATMATIYSVGDVDDDDTPLRLRLQQEVRADGKPVYGLATGISLMLFYAFAMQCMATLAIVKRELNSWKWALLQLIGMSLFAYLMSGIAYQLISNFA